MFWRAERLGAACTAETVTDDELVLKTTFKNVLNLQASARTKVDNRTMMITAGARSQFDSDVVIQILGE